MVSKKGENTQYRIADTLSKQAIMYNTSCDMPLVETIMALLILPSTLFTELGFVPYLKVLKKIDSEILLFILQATKNPLLWKR